ncbi:MAG: hypothetical protein LUC95_05115 [Lachnospiraceae bacterium]|nr:hypothetical protein [Lachnospiraceae bacterium]
MNYDKPFILGKIYSDAKYTMALLNGTIYINPLASFGVGSLFSEKKEMLNKYRGDLNEGLSTNIDVNNPTSINQAITFFQDIGGIPRDANAIGEIDTRFLSENVYCLSALFYDSEKGELLPLNEKLVQFADKKQGLAIVIYDVKQFLYRIIQTLSDSLGSLYWVAYGLVDYDFDEHSNEETDEFTKEQAFSYQQEFRISINLVEDSCRVRKNTGNLKYDSEKGTISLNIGSIRDIAFVLPVEDYINLKFSDGYQWVKTTQPAQICTFYPPLKNQISYICPLIRIDNTIFISENAMYPARRNLNAFSINRKRLEKTLILYSEKDSFFLSVLESYFSRILDICKSKNDEFLLNQMLTAIMYYLLTLNISRCAGIHLEIENGVLNASYRDMCLHDSSLYDGACYEVMQKKILQPKPSDFAVLVSLSNQERFEEYEYEGKKYTRIEVARDGILPSGRAVKKGEAVWVEVSKVKFLGY